MTDSEKRQIMAMWESGISLKKIKRTMPMTDAEFQRAINDMRKSGELGTQRVSTLVKVLLAFDGGIKSVSKIADMYGIKEKTVRTYLVQSGRNPERKKRVWTHTERTIDIANDIREGVLTQYAISKKYGVSRQYVSKMKEKMDKGVVNYEC